jgi:hypothetical protein
MGRTALMTAPAARSASMTGWTRAGSVVGSVSERRAGSLVTSPWPKARPAAVAAAPMSAPSARSIW